jgi:hypothetical protein
MATVPTVSWDETSPAGNTNASLGDNRIRELKTQIREIIDVDHDFPSSGQATDNGQHKKVTLQEQADLGTGAVGTTILGSQTIATKGELVYTDEDDNDIQLTKAGVAYPSQSTVLADWSAIMNLVYPVGSYYFNDSVSTNPGTLLGVGTWTAVEEVVLVGYKSGSTEFGTPGGAYGAKTVTLTAAQSGLPAHNHTYAVYNGDSGGASVPIDIGSKQTVNNFNTSTVPAASAAEAHNNCQPSRTVYMWRRTA